MRKRAMEKTNDMLRPGKLARVGRIASTGCRNVLLGAITLLMATACRPPKESGSPDPAAAKGPTISASPNPVPAGDGDGTTTLQWDAGDGQVGEVYVAVDGGEEKIFAKRTGGTETANWIRAGLTYEFRLYAAPDRARLLGSVKVTRAKP